VIVNGWYGKRCTARQQHKASLVGCSASPTGRLGTIGLDLRAQDGRTLTLWMTDEEAMEAIRRLTAALELLGVSRAMNQMLSGALEAAKK
jgi:hypothetical protein